MLIALEGIDGCGKTTLGKVLAERLGCALLHFPDDNAVTGPAIRGYLRCEWWTRERARADHRTHTPSDHGAMAFQALQVVNRLEHLPRLHYFQGHRGEHLILSRYTASSVVYGAHDGLDPEWLVKINEALPQPDLWVWLATTPEECARRREARDGAKAPERYEGDLDRLRDLERGFARFFSGPAGERLVHLNGSTAPQVLADSVVRVVEERAR